MTEDGRSLTCVAGDMQLSPMMRSMLTDYCAAEPLPEADRTTPTRWGGRWHCALDGTAMSAQDYLLPMCPMCGRILPGHVI